MPKTTLLAPGLVALLLVGCFSVNQSVEIDDGSVVDGGVSTVNGSVRIGSQCEVKGSVSNVNGSIQVGAQSRVGSINNVNGSISLSEDVQTDSAETVNGRIRMAGGVVVAGDLSTVNGTIEAASEVAVSGDIATVNGRIELGPGSRVDGEVAAVNGSITLVQSRIGSLRGGVGDISVLEGSVIDGELRVRETRKTPSNPPRVLIGENARIGGRLVFEQAVDLHIHESAEVGAIEGAEAQYYSGEAP
jgi:ethanolamine utilization microcompartment shell protein EutS